MSSSADNIQFDFTDILQTVERFYPIGINKYVSDLNSSGGKLLEMNPEYFESEGIQALDRLILDNIHDQNRYQSCWLNFCEEISEVCQKEVRGTTFGNVPGLSAVTVLKEQKSDQSIERTELHFAVSLLNKYYQIFGKAVYNSIRHGKPFGPPSENLITSPLDEIIEIFVFVERKIQERFKDYRIIPFSIGMKSIKGLSVSYIDQENCIINQALFNNLTNSELNVNSIVGDINYGNHQWPIKSNGT